MQAVILSLLLLASVTLASAFDAPQGCTGVPNTLPINSVRLVVRRVSLIR